MSLRFNQVLSGKLIISLFCLLALLESQKLCAQNSSDVKEQIRRLIPSATAIDRKLFESMARAVVSPKASDYNDHSLTAELFFTDYKTAQASGGQFRYLTEKAPRPSRMAQEMYRSIGGARLRLVTHPVTMIQQDRITKFDVHVQGRTATGTCEFRVPELYEGKADFTAERKDDQWRIVRLQMPGLKIDLKVDESGQWWRSAELGNFAPPECLVGHAGTIWSLDFSEDGTRLVSGGSDRSIRIWRIAEESVSLTIPRAHSLSGAIPLEGGVLSVCFSPDENRIASSSDDGTVKIWSTANGELTLAIDVKGIVSDAVFATSGRTILSSSSALELWDAKTGELEQTIRGHSYPSTAVSPDGLRIATGGADPKREDPDDDRLTLKLWDAKSGEPLATSEEHHRVLITDIAFSPDGKRIASCGRDKTIRIWDATDLRQLVLIETEQDSLQSISWNPDGRLIVSGDLSGAANIWNTTTAELENSLPVHPQGIRCVQFHPDSKGVVTAGDDGVIRLWDFSPSKTR